MDGPVGGRDANKEETAPVKKVAMSGLGVVQLCVAATHVKMDGPVGGRDGNEPTRRETAPVK